MTTTASKIQIPVYTPGMADLTGNTPGHEPHHMTITANEDLRPGSIVYDGNRDMYLLVDHVEHTTIEDFDIDGPYRTPACNIHFTDGSTRRDHSSHAETYTP